jgi:hypothetical protein
MLTKIYVYTWFVVAAAFLVILAAGSVTMTTVVIFGFIAFGMVFMGMMGVLPIVVTHSHVERLPQKKKEVLKPTQVSIPQGVHSVRV